MSWEKSAQLVEIVHDKLVVGRSVDDLEMELANNTWRISMSSTERKLFSEGDLHEFFEQVIRNREMQLRELTVDHGLYFYLWHDRQAAQLRFSLISDLHSTLPFTAKIIQADLGGIIRAFLRSDDVTSYAELAITDATQENMFDDTTGTYTLKVYQRRLTA